MKQYDIKIPLSCGKLIESLLVLLHDLPQVIVSFTGVLLTTFSIIRFFIYPNPDLKNIKRDT